MKLQLIQLNLALMVMLSVPTGVLVAAQPAPAASKAERAFNTLKSIYTLEYLDGHNGKYRNASLLNKIVRQPGRAFATAAVYGLTFFAAKKLYDFADKQGVFESMKAQAQRAQTERALHDYRKRQREIFQQRNPGQENIVAAPDVPGRPGNIGIANPLAGRQLQIPGIPRLRGFYHMESNMPHFLGLDQDGVFLRGPCGIHSVYNMAQVEARIMGRQIPDEEFDEALQAAIPNLREIHAGTHALHVGEIAVRLNLAPVVALQFDRNGRIVTARGADYEYVGGERERRAAEAAAMIGAAEHDFRQAANEFHRAHGPRVAHFLCGIPGHWVAISVTRNAQGEQAMYLYDNLNEQAEELDHMRRHIENIYQRFF